MKPQEKDKHLIESECKHIESLKLEIEAVTTFMKGQEDFRTAPVDKLIDIVLRRFSNEALLQAITALSRLVFRFQEQVAKFIPDSKLDDSVFLKELAQKATWMSSAKDIIARMKQLGVIDKTTMIQEFKAITGFIKDVHSETHAQGFALCRILRAEGFKVASMSIGEFREALKYLDSAHRKEINFDINKFVGFFSSAKFIGTEMPDEDTILRDFVLASKWFNEVKYTKVPWIILPPGKHPFPALIEYFESYAKKYNKRLDEESKDRLKKIESLNPTAGYIGRDEFKGYAIFFFEEYNKAILERPFYGYATYVIKGDWEALSRLTKRELLRNHLSEVDRKIHSGDWFSKLKEKLYK